MCESLPPPGPRGWGLWDSQRGCLASLAPPPATRDWLSSKKNYPIKKVAGSPPLHHQPMGSKFWPASSPGRLVCHIFSVAEEVGFSVPSAPTPGLLPKKP